MKLIASKKTSQQRTNLKYTIRHSNLHSTWTLAYWKEWTSDDGDRCGQLHELPNPRNFTICGNINPRILHVLLASKMRWQTSRGNFSQQNKEKNSYVSSYVWKWVVWSLTDTMRSSINMLITLTYFGYNWHNTFKIHVPNLIIVEFLLFMKPLLKWCSKYLPSASTHAGTYAMSCRNISEVPRRFWMDQ